MGKIELWHIYKESIRLSQLYQNIQNSRSVRFWAATNPILYFHMRWLVVSTWAGGWPTLECT
jgi:hypothetical protein